MNWIDFGDGTKGLETTSGWIIKGSGVIYVPDTKKKLKAGIIVPPVVEPPIVPPVEPPVVPPVNPAVRKPTIVKNMKLLDGIYRSNLGWERMAPKIVDVEYLVPEINYGSTVTVKFSRRANFKYTTAHNIKPFRAYKNQPGDYPNFYFGKPSNGGWIWYVEDLSFSPSTHINATFPAYTETFREELWEWKVNSGPGKSDGAIRITIGGMVVLNSNAVQFDSESKPGIQRVICVQDYIASVETVPEGSWIEYTQPEITVK